METPRAFQGITLALFFKQMMTAFVVYLLLLVVIFLMQRNFIYFPGVSHQTPSDIGAKEMGVVSVQPHGADFKIEGWYRPPTDALKPVIVYFHGNAMTIPYGYTRMKPFIDAGYGLMLAEYRGYNGNPGKPTEKALYADADAYVEWIVDHGKIPENRIVFYGFSLGTGVAVDQAVKHRDAAAVILESPYTSLADVAQRTYFFAPARLLMLDQYQSQKRIGGIRSPLLVLHGVADSIVPFRQGKALFDMANEPKTMKVYPVGNHVNLDEHGAIDDTLDFLARLGPRR